MPDPEWPEFTIPTAANVSSPAPTPPTSPDTSAAAPTPPTSPDTSAAAPTPPTPAAEEMFPKHRFDEMNTRFEAVRQQNEQLTKLLTTLVTTKAAMAADAAAAKPVDPEKQQIIDQLHEYLGPNLRGALALADKAPVLDELIARFNAFEARAIAREKAEETAAVDYAQRSLAAVHDQLAPLFLGKDKAGKDLDPSRRQALTNLYVQWVGEDATRIDRYNRQDDTLRQDFVKAYQDQWVEPFRRASAATAVREARKVSSLPVGGTTTSTLGTPPAKPLTSDDEDAPFNRAAAMAMDLKNA